MDTLQNMRMFVRVVEAGSFTAAAESLNRTIGAMSRAVSELETRLRTRLFNRSTRRVALTPAGERYLQRCRQILAELSSAEEEASGAHERPAGALRMHSFASIGQHYVLPAISRYRALHPDVTVELTMSQRMPNLFDGSSDVSVVTASALPDSDVISHQLGSTYSVLCASPEYVRLRGAPRIPADLSYHDCLTLKMPSVPANEWTLEGPGHSVEVHVTGLVQVNIAESLSVAISQGMGIGTLPVHAAIEGLRNGTLVRVLPLYKLRKTNVYALYPSRKYVDARTRTWVEFMRTHFPAMLERDLALLEQLTHERPTDRSVAKFRQCNPGIKQEAGIPATKIPLASTASSNSGKTNPSAKRAAHVPYGARVHGTVAPRIQSHLPEK